MTFFNAHGMTPNRMTDLQGIAPWYPAARIHLDIAALDAKPRPPLRETIDLVLRMCETPEDCERLPRGYWVEPIERLCKLVIFDGRTRPLARIHYDATVEPLSPRERITPVQVTHFGPPYWDHPSPLFPIACLVALVHLFCLHELYVADLPLSA